MPRSFRWKLGREAGEQGVRVWLQGITAALTLLVLIALYLLVAPPGGSRSSLMAEGEQLREQIAAAKSRSQRLRLVSNKVQLGSEQSTKFEAKYILPKRQAYERLVSELQRMTKASGLQARDASNTEEPIEGSADLTLLTSSANYEGSYQNLRKFLIELDHSPMLIMLDQLQASPQQKTNQINTSMRFQTILQEDTAVLPMARAEGMP